MLGTALYYPHIDINDTGWLRSAMLFWDEIQTIVPSAIHDPYRKPDTKICAEEGYLRPLHCDLYEEVLSDLGTRMVSLMGDAEWLHSVSQGLRGPTDEALLHADKMSHEMMWRIEDMAGIHPDKMPPQMRAMILGPLGIQLLAGQKINPRLRHLIEDLYDQRIHPEKLSRELRKRFNEDNGNWLFVDRQFASVYMSALAALLAKKIEISPLTNETMASGVNLRCFGDDITSSSPSAARGALVSVVMQSLRIDPATPINNILKFRRHNIGQLGEISQQFDDLKKTIEKSEEGTDIHSNAKRVFENKIRPSMEKLKNELRRNTIESAWSGFQTASTFSALPSTALWATGLSSSVALGASAFITAAGMGVKSYLARSKVRTDSPYTYLLDVERKFSLPK